MEGFKGTPGKWSFEHNCVSDKDIFCINVMADGCSDICYLQSSEEFLPNREQTLANANLIAAAPELLEALQGLLIRVADDEEYGPDHAITKREPQYLRRLASNHYRREGMEWIKCSEMKPELDGKYLTFGSYGIGTSWYHTAFGRRVFQDCDTNNNEGMTDWDDLAFQVTHWMPLPEPPAE
ncbi:hypothetical protein HA48_14705 [Pantoea wallisii]|uniref:DUF551 domain-containing protein n=1 Tax=Pantoea wallisii TaxID=1076551 RepID=A0A1X1D6U5_9GAMM|nr:DUF551 domain-containing protein [Pantoea wallisii]ORM72403.1 hypothetical protein HA48_14705 [Pantoea wallisii]